MLQHGSPTDTTKSRSILLARFRRTRLSVFKSAFPRAQRIELTGWPPFLKMDIEESRPYPVDDHVEAWIGRGTDENSPRTPDVSDYWRASRKGQLYIVRGYTEDSLEKRKNVRPGTVLDISMPVWRIGEILYFSARFLTEFQDVQAVVVNCRFTGLYGRTVTSLDWRRLTRSRSCHQSEVETTATVTVAQLEENMVEIVHKLLAPLYEAFDFYALSPTLVEEELGSLRKNRF